jgi:uncharacterized repeat protein (TIGR01451 family)
MTHLGRAVVVSLLLAFGLVATLTVPASAFTAASVAAPVDVFIGDVTDHPDPARLGTLVFYSVPVGNNGPGTLTAATVTVQMPSGMVFEPALSSGGCVASGAVVTCEVSNVPPGGGIGLQLAMRPEVAGVLSLMFTVSTAQTDRDPSNDSQTELTTVVAEADVGLQLEASAIPLFAGQPFFMSARAFNVGPAPATNVTAVLRFPAGLSVLLGGSCVPDGAETVCTFPMGQLPSGAGSIAIIQVVGSVAGDHTITGVVTAAETDPLPLNNTASLTVSLAAAADLGVTISESADPSGAGRVLTYKVAVTNLGPSPASAVTLTDEWSTSVAGGARLLSVNASQGSCSVSPEMIECALGEVPSGAVATVTIRLRPMGVGTVTNSAVVAGVEPDLDTANNTATESTVIG